MTKNIEKLKELIADGYKIIREETFITADPNQISSIKLTLVKNDCKIKMTFKENDARIAKHIYKMQS